MKNAVSVFFLLVFFNILFAGCSNREQGLGSGPWRATLKTESGAEIPFNFEVADSAGKKYIDIINGKERLRVNEIFIKDDSLHIMMPLFDSEITAVKDGRSYKGKWIKHLANTDTEMQFQAEPDASWRFFKANVSPQYTISGRWSSTFYSYKDTTMAIAELEQRDNKLTGTFLTPLGDYRFLEGTVSDGKLYLSCFDGSHAFLFTAKLKNDSTITEGKFYSGYSSVEHWTARKDANAMLPDAYSLTVLRPGYKQVDFSFPDLQGNNISLSDEKYKNKVVIVQFFGSWCPNCMDETAYLSPFYKKYKGKGIEVIGLGYERTTNFERSKNNIMRLRKRFDVEYDMLVTGYTNDTKEVARSLPMLTNFIAFPTTILIDKKGDVRKIHTGFSGPGTGNHYVEFVNDFEKTIDGLLAE